MEDLKQSKSGEKGGGGGQRDRQTESNSLHKEPTGCISLAFLVHYGLVVP